MAMTAQVKAELASTQITKTCCRKAEVATMLRFAGGLHIVSGRIVVEAELDTGAAARRLRTDIAEVYGHESDVVMVQGNGHPQGQPLHRPRRQGRRGAGPPDRPARPARPSGARAAARRRLRRRLRRRRRVARGVPRPRLAHRARPVLVARGHLPGPRGGAGAGRRGPPARHPGQGPRGARRRPRRASATATRSAQLLTRLGAHESLMAWEERRMRREVRATANRLANFDDANLRRSARAAVAAGARVERAMEILGDEVPDHLKHGRRAAPRAQAGLARGARPAARPGAHQGRHRRAGSAGCWRWPTSGPRSSASPTPRPR